MTWRRIVLGMTALALGVALAGPVWAADSKDSAAKSLKPQRPAPQLFDNKDLDALAALQNERPLKDDVVAGQWAETDVWAWTLTLGIGAAIGLALALHGPP